MHTMRDTKCKQLYQVDQEKQNTHFFSWWRWRWRIFWHKVFLRVFSVHKFRFSTIHKDRVTSHLGVDVVWANYRRETWVICPSWFGNLVCAALFSCPALSQESHIRSVTSSLHLHNYSVVSAHKKLVVQEEYLQSSSFVLFFAGKHGRSKRQVCF